MSLSMRTLVAGPRSAGSATREMVHAAMSTPARMFSPSDVALTMFASSQCLRSRQWRGRSSVLYVEYILPCLKPQLFHYVDLNQPDSDLQKHYQ